MYCCRCIVLFWNWYRNQFKTVSKKRKKERALSCKPKRSEYTHTETHTLSRRQCHTWTRARPRLSAKHTSQLLYGDCGLTPARADDVSRPLVDRGNLDGHVTASGVNVQDMSLQMTLKSGVVFFFSLSLYLLKDSNARQLSLQC